MKNLIRRIDALAPNINLTFNEESSKKTLIGGLTTILVLLFAVYCTIYFGKDIIEKEKPITRFSKTFVNESRIYKDEFPLAIFFSDKLGNPYTDIIETLMDFEPQLYDMKFNETSKSMYIDIYQLKFGKCEKNDFGKYQTLFTDPKNGVPLTDVYCIKPNYIKSPTGVENLNSSDVYYMNEWGAIPSKFLYFPMYECNSTQHNKTCLSKEERQKFLNEFYIIVFFPDYYIDLNDYMAPEKMYIYSYTLSVSLGITKSTNIRMKNTNIQTDSGIVMEDLDDKNIYQFDSIRTETNLVENQLVQLFIESTRLKDSYFRKYTKIQDILTGRGFN